MYVTIAPVQIRPGYRDKVVEELLKDARGAVHHEPGCLRFDVIQDGDEPNRVWVYEVYKDEAAFQEHLKAPYFIHFMDVAKGWLAERPLGAGQGAYNIWPPDDEWQ